MKPARPDTKRAIAAAAVAHGAWLGLFLVHLPILGRLLGAASVRGFDVATAGSLLGLAAVTAFFLLKSLNVRWLRWDSRRGSLLAFLLIAAIAHHEVLPAAHEPLVLAVSVTLVAAGLIDPERWRRLAGVFATRTPATVLAPIGVVEPVRLSGRTHRGGFARGCRAPPWTSGG